MGIVAYFLYNSIFVLDLWDLLLRLYWRMKHTAAGRRIKGKHLAFPTSIHLGLPPMTEEEKKRQLKPFAIVVSVCNAEGYIREFLESFKPSLDRLMVVDDYSTDGTYRILEEYGVRYLRNERNMKKPASIKRGVAALPEEVETVIVIDPDSRFVESGLKKDITDMEEVISDFQRSGLDGCAVRINVKEENSILVKFQELEYRVSLSLGRKSLMNKSITSGISIYKRKSLEDALNRHPLSVYAEDFMTALLILNNGGDIYYDGRLLVETEGKSTWRGLVSQRIGWDFGFITAYFYAVRRVMEKKDIKPLLLTDKRFILFYSYFIYLAIFGILFHPIKLFTIGLLCASLINLMAVLSGLPLPFQDPFFTPLWFIIFYLQYGLLTAGIIYSSVESGRKNRYWFLIPLYPFYALFLLLIRTIGFLNYFTLLLFGRKVYYDHYEAEQ